MEKCFFINPEYYFFKTPYILFDFDDVNYEREDFIVRNAIIW